MVTLVFWWKEPINTPFGIMHLGSENRFFNPNNDINGNNLKIRKGFRQNFN